MGSAQCLRQMCAPQSPATAVIAFTDRYLVVELGAAARASLLIHRVALRGSGGHLPVARSCWPPGVIARAVSGHPAAAVTA